MDISAANRAKLRALFPAIFSETVNNKGEVVESVDIERLKAELGTFTDLFEARKERYGFEWPGKKDSLKAIQSPTYATLKPCPIESINFDTTENIFIEGDNLEVLKLLQKSYYGQVKMIYIDPPYNTGEDFIYPDNFEDSISNYLEIYGLSDEQGRRKTIGKNSPDEARFHTKWLNSIYPRIYLARNLLREDGVFLVSINDKEQSSLKAICHEIFGEENFLAQLVWDKNHSAQAGIFKVYHEYVLVYAKNREMVSVPKSLEGDDFGAGAMKKESSRHPMQKFTFPKGTRFDAEDGYELTGAWGDAEKVILHRGRMIARDGQLTEAVELEAAFTQANQMRQFFYGDREALVDSRGQKIKEFYFTKAGKLKIIKERGVYTPPTVHKWGTQGEISKELAELFGLSAPPLETPKSKAMIIDFVSWFCDDDDVILDFYAGSGTTAHGILEFNKKYERNNKFILVQVPEVCSEGSFAEKNGFKTIAEIAKKRIALALKSYSEGVGFKVFKLDRSNFKKWSKIQPDEAVENIIAQLELHVEHIESGASSKDLVYEILIKAGYRPTAKIDLVSVGGGSVYRVEGGEMYICLEEVISKDFIDEVINLSPPHFVCLDSAFFGNDQLKANVVQAFAAANQDKDKKNQIVFRTI